jgi:hypothetical protein
MMVGTVFKTLCLTQWIYEQKLRSYDSLLTTLRASSNENLAYLIKVHRDRGVAEH